MSISTKVPVPMLDAVPAELQSLPWKLWRLDPPNEAGHKPRKTPISIHTFHISNDVTTFEDCGPFDLAKSLLEKEQLKPYEKQRFHGAACLIDPAKGLACVDLDHAIDGNGEPQSFAAEILNAVDGFVERSVSGVGYHIFTRVDPEQENFSNNAEGVELFVEKRFIAFTGQEDKQFSKPIPTTPQNVETVLKYSTKQRKTDSFERFKQPDPSWTISRVENELLSKLPKSIGYEEWLSVGQILHHQFEGSPEGYELFDRWSASCADYPSAGEQSTLDKWQSFGKKTDKDSLTIGSLVQKAKYYEHKFKYESAPSDEPLFAPLSAAVKSSGQIQWLVEDRIKCGSLAMFAAPPATGKTYLALEVGMCVATGKPFLDKLKTTQGVVVYICNEDRDGVINRCQAWASRKNDSVIPPEFYVSRGDMVVLGSADAENSIQSAAKFLDTNNIRPTLVVIDTMVDSLGDADENNSNDMADFFRVVEREFVQKYGATVLFPHHLNKSGGYRGSTAIKGKLGHMYYLDEVRDGVFEIKEDKNKFGPRGDPFCVRTEKVAFDLADGKTSSNLVLYPIETSVSPNGFNSAQQHALKILFDTVGLHGEMPKKDLREGLAEAGYSQSENHFARFLEPLKKKAFIRVGRTTVALMKTETDFGIFDESNGG